MRILIAFDGSQHAKAAIDNLPRAGLPRQAEALVVSVAHRGWPDVQDGSTKEGPFDSHWKTTMKEADALAEYGRNRVQFLFPAWSVSSEPLWGDVAKILLMTADIWKPDLIVVGSHGRSLPARLLLGSVSAELVHRAPCSVRVVRGSPRVEGPIRILIATDGSEQADAAVRCVAKRFWPEGTRARLFAVTQTLAPAPALVPALERHTLATEPAYRVIEAADQQEEVRLCRATQGSAELLQQVGLSAEAVVVEGDPRREINAEAERWQADSVFVGARGLGALDRLLLGSVSGSVVSHAPCAVEIVRGP